MTIPLHSPSITNLEESYVSDVLASSELKGGQKYTQKCQNIIEDEFRCNRALLTTSCTHALEMAALLLGISEGDEVIVPSYTFPSTATAFALHGAEITFCDVTEPTLNMDTDHLERLITSETKAVVPIHYAGVGADMNAIQTIADRYQVPVVEDAAQAVNSTENGDYLGTIGDIGCFSFHETKSYVAGEGGAILLNDPKLGERAEIIRQKGTNYAKFRRGEVEEYSWVDHGSSYVPSELQAAVAAGQLERRDAIRSNNRKAFQYYRSALTPLKDEGCITVPHVPERCESNYHQFFLLTEHPTDRDKLIEFLEERRIEAASHYRPLHESEMGKQFYDGDEDLSTTQRAAKSIVRLPTHGNIDETELASVVTAIFEFFENERTETTSSTE